MALTAKGFTLIEALTVLAISAILLGTMVPSVTHMLSRSQATAAHNWLIGSIMFARQTAISYGSLVTLCPSYDGNQCGGKWHDGTIAFIDRNRNARVDPKDVIMKRFHFPIEGATITWRSFRNRRYLQLTSMGYTNFQNGNFVYCSADQDPRYRRQIVINMSGRARTTHDVDKDGIIEDSRGRYLRC